MCSSYNRHTPYHKIADILKKRYALPSLIYSANWPNCPTHLWNVGKSPYMVFIVHGFKNSLRLQNYLSHLNFAWYIILAGNDLGIYIWGYFREKQDVFQKCKDFRVVIKLLTPAKMKIVQNLIKSPGKVLIIL